MGKSLNKTEITGLAFLALLVIGITACAVLLRECKGGGGELPDDVRIEVVDTIVAKAPVWEDKASAGGKKTGRKEKAGKNKSRKKKSAAEGNKVKSTPAERKDPFSDTIPVIN